MYSHLNPAPALPTPSTGGNRASTPAPKTKAKTSTNQAQVVHLPLFLKQPPQEGGHYPLNGQDKAAKRLLFLPE